jgi:hypothetical protein
MSAETLDEVSPLFPKVQSLLIADHVWNGQGRTCIAGAFTRIFGPKFPLQYGNEIDIFATLTNVREDTDVGAQIRCLHCNKPIAATLEPLKIFKPEDPNQSVPFILGLPAGAVTFSHPGPHALELTVHGKTIGIYRFRVDLK